MRLKQLAFNLNIQISNLMLPLEAIETCNYPEYTASKRTTINS